MSTFEVKCNPSSLENEGDSIVGQIWVLIDSQGFPDDHWYDFPVIILGWWLKELDSFFSGSHRTCQLWFMDGPYFMAVQKGRVNALEIQLFRNEIDGDRVRGGAKITRASLISTIVAVATQVASECNKNGWTSDDIESLRSAVERYERRLGGGTH